MEIIVDANRDRVTVNSRHFQAIRNGMFSPIAVANIIDEILKTVLDDSKVHNVELIVINDETKMTMGAY